MKKYKLGDLLSEFHAGKAIQTENIKNKGAYPVYGGNGQRGYTDSYNQDGEYLIIGRQGAYCGNVRYNIGKAYLTEHAIVGQTREDHNPIYIALKLSLMKLSQLQGQSAQPGLSVNTLSCISMEMPPKEIQDKIADIMLKLDRKIELNRQINDNLEAMAKQLYEYWFVQFDFPNEEGKPYKSSGGAMVWNEKLKREIPQGWNILPISDILDKYPTTKRYETKEYLQIGKYPIIDQGDAYIVGFTNENDNLLTRHPAVLFGDHSTKVKFLDFDFARGADGTQILYSSNDAVSQYYLYLVVSALQIPNPGYSRHFKYLKELPIVIPSLSIATKFVNIVKPLFEKWTKNIFNNIALTKQRDELLPLLMNGQASVNYHLSAC